MGSLKVRFSQSSERVGELNYALRVEVVSSEGMPAKIFIFHQMPAGVDGNTFAEFDHVATPVDFQEIPEDAASELVPWYRSDKCAVWFRSISDLRMAKQMFVDDIYELQRNFNVLTSEEDFRDQTTLEFSEEGVQEVSDVQMDEPISLRSMAKIFAVSSMLLLGSYSSLGASVQSADLNKQDLDTNPSVVTNVTFEGLATSEDIQSAISTNNQNFVNAVKNTPITFPSDIDVGDLAGYGTIGTLIVAMAASIAWLKSKATSTDTALAGKADTSDLPYALVTPGEWEFSDGLSHEISGPRSISEPGGEVPVGWVYASTYNDVDYYSPVYETEALALATLEITFSRDGDSFTATRPSLPGHLLDRAVNEMSVSSETELTLPALSEYGKARDFIVLINIPSSVADVEGLVSFVGSGSEEIHYYVGGSDPSTAEFPYPTDVGEWSYGFSELKEGWFAVSLRPVVEAIQTSQTQEA